MTHKPGPQPYAHLHLRILPMHAPTLWHLETATLNLSYARQDCTPGSMIFPGILYIRRPWFLIHSLSGEVLAMPSKTEYPSALTLRTRAEKLFHSMLT